MSSDVIIGKDGKPRCSWAGAGDTAFGRYHDEVWGTRSYDESAMFEALTLGEVGLSWSIGEASFEQDPSLAPEEAALTIRERAPGAVDHPEEAAEPVDDHPWDED